MQPWEGIVSEIPRRNTCWTGMATWWDATICVLKPLEIEAIAMAGAHETAFVVTSP